MELLGAQSFEGVDVAFFAAGPAVAGEHAPVAADAGAAVIDLSSRFRLDDAVPLVVPEVNPAAIADRRERGIVANPSATAIALAVVLAPLAEVGFKRVLVSTYQGMASAGRRAMEALSRETVDLLNARGTRSSRFPRRIAFNCVPQVGALLPGGATAHELQAIEETRKVLAQPGLPVQLTAVRVPIFFGAGYSVDIETEQPLDAAAATDLLRNARGLVVGDPESYPTPADVTGTEAIHVGRIRDDASSDNALSFWVTLDTIRKGAALNAVEIAEILVRDYL